MEEQILELSVVDPDRGLTAQQVQQRQEAGLDNQVTARAGRTEKDIILQNILTFFNLVFVVLAVVLVIGGSSVKNMTFLIVVLINTAIGIAFSLVIDPATYIAYVLHCQFLLFLFLF